MRQNPPALRARGALHPMDWSGHTILAPLTKGGNLPFRRLCVELGARITMSEMAYSRQVKRRSRAELALLRKHPDEPCFGVQLAISRPADGAAAARAAVERGAAFVDVNAGCPTNDVVRRGMGATLLCRPAALGRIVEALVAALEVPVTVKIRTGWREGEVNASEIARLCEEAGASALTVHGRTREQRYTSAADWELIGQIVEERSIPVIGNGDILTWYEARDRSAVSGCASVMVARGALVKPWIFGEIARGRTWLPTVAERIAVYLRLASFMKEHFGDDELGRTRAMRFLPWHMGFFARYRSLPDQEFEQRAREHPLLQTRMPSAAEPGLEPLERLLRDPREVVHEQLAAALWESTDAADATGEADAAGEADATGEADAATATDVAAVAGATSAAGVAGAVERLERLAAEVGPPDPEADQREFAVAQG